MSEGRITLELLTGTAAEKAAMQPVLEASPTYYARVSGGPASPTEAEQLFTEAPPGRTPADKRVYAIALAGEWIGAVDLVLGYPVPTTAFLGLLLLREDHHGRGYGAAAYAQLEALVRSGGGYRALRLATVGTNESAGGFWKRMGFTETGERKPCRFGSIDTEFILFEKPLA